jgi:hypothetical protein
LHVRAGDIDTQKDILSISLCVRAVANAHPAAFRDPLVVLFGEANMPTMADILRGVKAELSYGGRMRVHIHSDDRKVDGVPITGFLTNNRTKENCVNTMRDYLSQDRIKVATPFVGEASDIVQLRRQMHNFEFEPIVDKTTGDVVGFTYSGKRSGPDDRGLAFQFALHFSHTFMRRLRRKETLVRTIRRRDAGR